MFNKAIMAIVSAALLLHAPVADVAAGTASILGQITVQGSATVNGATTPTGATLFSGDQVTTATETVAELLLKGENKVLLPQASAVVLSNEAAQVIVGLKQGSLAVLGRSAAPAFIDANGVRIKPAANAAIILEIAIAGGSLKVLARRGSAVVEAANKTLELAEGMELDATTAPAPPQGPSGPIATGRSRLLTWEFIAAAAAGVTGLALGITAVMTRVNPASCKAVSVSGSITCP